VAASVKWIFIAALLVLIPALTGVLRGNPRYRPHVAFLMGALPLFVVPYLYVAPISWAGWAGPVKGIEVSLLDAVALAVVLSTPRVPIPLSLKLSFGIIVLAIGISTSVGYQTMPALFYAWQLLRAVLLFTAVARLCAADRRAPLALMAGLGVALVCESIYAAFQFHGGDFRPGGNLGHSNFLGLASDFVVFPALALLLGGRRIVGPVLIVAAGFLIAVVGGSRATLGLFAIGSLLTIVLSLFQGRTSKKMAFAGAAALMMLVSAPLVIWAAERRTEVDKLSSDEDRASMKLAATMMVTDHPLGVGADQYVLVANMAGYSARAGVPWNESDRAAPVHDTYYLVTAELGFLGLVGLLSLFGSLIVFGWKALGRATGDDSSELIPGLLGAMIIVAVHISYEWVFMHFVLHYMLAIAAGLLVALVMRSKVAGKARRPAQAKVPVLSTAG
jgi:hypothetical protein